jgi:hypothetical protein
MAIEESKNVIVAATIEKDRDLVRVEWGEISKDQVRRIEVSEGRVNPRELFLCLPRPMIEHLGLHCTRTMKERTQTGLVSVRIFESVNIVIQVRDCTIEVKEIGDDQSPIIGHGVLTMLDWVIDPVQKKLIGNPDHGGEWIIDMYHQEFCV